MKRFLFFTFFIMLCNLTSAQVSDLVFIGKVIVKGGDVYTYKLQVNDSAGILKGYSVTDLMGPNETKTAVTGTIDAVKKQLSFRETSLLYTKSKADKADMCYIHAHLKVSNMSGVTALKGHFDGYKENEKSLCASGKIELVSAQDVLDKLLAAAKKDNIPVPDTTPAKPEGKYVYKTEKEVAESKVLKVLPGKTIELACSSPSVTVDIWDAKTIDGDIITLQQDGHTLLDNYTISGIHKQVSLDMGAQQASVLTLIAISEGSEPLNTARLKITSGDNTYYVDATTTIGKTVTVVLKR